MTSDGHLVPVKIRNIFFIIQKLYAVKYVKMNLYIKFNGFNHGVCEGCFNKVFNY